MKKLLACIIVICMTLGLVACSSGSDGTTVPTDPVYTGPFVDAPRILNADGSYGGSLDETKYGAGAPLNGQYDVADSDYYMVNNDYFNMTSHNERVIYPQFSTYQQTMADTSGIACLLMVLNYMGQDVVSKYNEKALLDMYEQVNNTTVYGNGTTEEGLMELVSSLGLGYTATNTDKRFNAYKNESNMKDFFTEVLKEGKFVLVRYMSPVGYSWKLLIGYDLIGKEGDGNIKETPETNWSDTVNDDVLIFAEPNDMADHRQDGYATERATDFYFWWQDSEINGKVHDTYSFIVIDTNFDYTVDYQSLDNEITQELYPIQLPEKPSGLATPHRGAQYYTVNDFYNMGSEGSRLLLSGYTVLQQTMQSTCGICAVGSVLKYYGREESYLELETVYMLQYERINNVKVNPKGSHVERHYAALTDWGYEAQWGGTTRSLADPDYLTYEEYFQFFKSNIEAGRPVVISSLLGSNHFYTIIGVDDMGTEHIYDDVIICADSADGWDGYRDGYDTFSAYKAFIQHANKYGDRLQNYIVIYPKN